MTERPANIAAHLRRRLKLNTIALRRGARAALVIPVAFLLARLLIGEAQALIFIVFGCFALLVMADFGGPRRERALAYLAAVTAGAVLVALGTLASATAIGGAAVMLVVGFGLGFAAVFGGYTAIARTGLLLAFVISVSLPAPSFAIPGRVGGWMLAGLLSTLAALLLWPRPEDGDLNARAGDAMLRVAKAVSDPAPASLVEAREAVRAARAGYTAGDRRPAGLSRRDRACFEMFAELDLVIDLLQHPFQAPDAAVRPGTAEGQRLGASVLDTLQAGASVLRGGAEPDLAALEQARSDHRAALDRWAAEQLQAGRPAAEVLDGLDHDHTLRVISYIALGIAGNAVIAAGRRLEPGVRLPAAIPRRAGLGGVLVRAWRTVLTHLEPRSAVLHNSLRVAIGLAASVFLARTLGLSHAFWVVLGTLQVLRSSALGTGRTTVQALAGNVLGVVVGGLIAVLAGSNPLVMWIVLPISVFVAAYSANTIGFMLSQAAFTINLIVVFNLVSPAGWQVGLVRIEDVVVGAAVSVVVGVLLWPRGARRELARSLSCFYRALATYLGAGFEAVLGVEIGDTDGLRREAVRARDRAGESFQLLLSEPGPGHLEPPMAAALMTAGSQAMLVADSLWFVATELGYRVKPGAAGAAAMRTQVQALLARLKGLAGRLDDGRLAAMGGAKPVAAPALRAATLGDLRRGNSEPAADRSTLALVIAGEWAQNLARLEADMEQPVSAAVAAARIPWWR